MALTVAPDSTATCKRGHIQIDDNVSWYRDRGVLRHRCRLCAAASMQRQRDRKAELDALIVGPSLSSQVRTIWSLMSPDLRWRVGSIMLAADGATALQKRVLARAAEKQTWYRSGSDVAARQFVQNLLDDTVDSRSRDLSIEALLALLYGPR